MKNKYILFLILLLGFSLRIIFINSSPPSLYGDELTIALDSNSILKTGHDQLGNRFPLTFPMGAGRPAGYVYASIPFVAIFGPSAMGIRAVSILSGLGIIILLYYIGRKLFSEKVGLAASFIVSVSPWDIALSRGGFEAHFALLLALLGFYLFTKAKEKPILYIFSALSFGAIWHTYPTYKVILLLFLPLLFWYQTGLKNIFNAKSKKYFLVAILLLLILGTISLSQTFIGGSETRFSDINIFSHNKLKDTIEQKINLERSITDMPQSMSKYFHNKPIEYTKVLIENYLQNFSLDFLTLHGDRNPRHNMATMGQVYFVEFILFFIGLISFWQKNRKILIILLFWLILAPIPAAIVDLPHALRSSFMLPPLIIFSALGLITIWNMKNKVILILISFLFATQFLFFIQKLYFLAPNEYGSFWSYSAKVASELVMQNQSKYKYIFLSDAIDSIEFAYPVYSEISPVDVISQNNKKTYLEGFSFKKFSNVYIGHIPDDRIESFLDKLGGSVLFIGTADTKNYLKDYETIEGQEGLSILTIKKVYK